MERKDGYLIIDELPRIDYKTEVVGGFLEGWYLDNGIKKMFKAEDTLMSYRELFYPLILQKLDLPTVKNDLASRGGGLIKGVLSSDYTVTEDINPKTVKNIAMILKAYFNKVKIYESPYYLDRLKRVLELYCKEQNCIYGKETENELLMRFIIQVLLGDSDLRPKNMETYIENGILRFSPFYDFGFYGTINIKNKEKPGYLFRNRFLPTDIYKTPADMTIKDFLKNAPRNQIEVFKEYLEKLQYMQIEEVFIELKEQIEYEIPEGIKYVLNSEIKNNLDNIRELVKK